MIVQQSSPGGSEDTGLDEMQLTVTISSTDRGLSSDSGAVVKDSSGRFDLVQPMRVASPSRCRFVGEVVFALDGEEELSPIAMPAAGPDGRWTDADVVELWNGWEVLTTWVPWME